MAFEGSVYQNVGCCVRLLKILSKMDYLPILGYEYSRVGIMILSKFISSCDQVLNLIFVMCSYC